ncbi:unnamed protein product, partial [Hapterophycus canaliculatus]
AHQASPREGKPDSDVRVRSEGKGGRSMGGGSSRRRKLMKRGPATSEKRGMYHGIQVPLDAFEKPFAGGSEIDALPARLESLIFPSRYVNWPKEDAAFPTLSKDVESNPMRHAVAFRSGQPRIVCHDPQRETRGWAGPGAYEWDDRPVEGGDGNDNDNSNGNSCSNSNSNNNDDGDVDGGPGASCAGRAGAESEATAGGGHGSNGRSAAAAARGAGKASRKIAGEGRKPRGISVRDPLRLSPVFREGSSGFVAPAQTNVRGFAPAPFSRVASAAAAVAAVGVFSENAGEGGGRGGGGEKRARCGGVSARRKSVAFDESQGGVRRK